MLIARSSSRRCCSLIAAILMLMPVASMANAPYEFIKFECDRTAKAVAITIPHLNRENPNGLIDRIRSGKAKDMYEFDELANKNQKIKCDLGDDQVVSLYAGRSKHVANNTIFVSLNGVWILHAPIIHLGKVKIFVTSLQENEVGTKTCSLDSDDIIRKDTCEEHRLELISRQIPYVGDLSSDDIKSIKEQFSGNKTEDTK
jgi:hypothetical protein